MKIGIDARVLDRKMTGTGRYLKNLLDGIPYSDNKNDYFVFINDASCINLDFFKQVNVKVSIPHEKVDSFFWLNFILPGEVKRLKLDVFFTCNILLPLADLNGAKKITVVHDVIFKARKEFYPLSYRMYLNNLLPITFRQADKILTASSYSRNDILKFYELDSNKIEVLYTCADPKFKPQELDENQIKYYRNKYNLPVQFILFVGVIEKRKNIDGLFQIAWLLYEKGIDIPIVLVGRPGFGYSDIQERSKQSEGRIKYINFVDDNDLAFIYNLAKIFIFPSFYEGFGIPPLEAMQSGIPVISSGLTSLPEVLGEAAIYFNPTEIDCMAGEIIRLLNNPAYYRLKSETGIKRAREFNYFKSAQKLVEIFNKFKQ